jgi:aryl-alcohol dehydrogenase-like predicted oxidoreductase
MDKIQLGNTDLHVAPIMLGGNVFGWTIDEKKSFEVLDAFVEKGFNFIDTADVYSRWVPGNQGGESETIIGKWLKQKSDADVIVATKVGSDMGEGKSLKKDYIIRQVEASLKRLQLEQIDLYFAHFDDEATPVEETMEAFDSLVKAGKVRWLGASNLSPERLAESLIYSEDNNIATYRVLQPEYNLYDRQKFEQEYESIVKQNELGVVSYYALASGFLTGKYQSEADFDKSARGQGMKKYLNPRGASILKALDSIAQKHSVSQAAIALAWLINHPSITAPIASATSTEQIETFEQAASVYLSEEDISVLNQSSAY